MEGVYACFCVRVSRYTVSMCAVKFSCVIPEAPQTPSQVFLFLRRVFIIIDFFTNRWILDSVSFHFENHKHSTNMMESLFQGALTLLFPFFMTQYPLILHIRVEYHCGHASERMPQTWKHEWDEQDIRHVKVPDSHLEQW